MKYYIIAGEASGDLHASNLIKEIKQLDKEAKFRCWGGELINEQLTMNNEQLFTTQNYFKGAHENANAKLTINNEKGYGELVRHYRETSYMGFLEIIFHIPSILKNINYCKKDILQYKPDALILVDYPGFNLRIAEFAKQSGIRVFYYISPQVWAWKQSRVKKIKKNVDKMLTILPFEKEFYKSFNFDVDYVGHPLLDEIENYKKSPQSTVHSPQVKIINNSDKPIIALFPGSRKQEISNMLSVMLKVIPEFKDYQFVIGGMSAISPAFYEQYLKDTDVKIVYDQTYNLLSASYAAVVTSGTATLETALFEIPEVVCYKGNYLSYLLAKSFVKIKYISLVNLILNRKVIAELIQKELNEVNIKNELTKIVNDKSNRDKIISDYKELKQQLGGAGASRKAAEIIYKAISD